MKTWVEAPQGSWPACRKPARIQAGSPACSGGVLGGRGWFESPIRYPLLQAGLPQSALEVHLSELGAVQRLLAWSRPGDVLVLPVHDRAVRAQTLTLVAAKNPA